MRVSVSSESVVEVDKSLLRRGVQAVLVGEAAEFPPNLLVIDDEKMIQLHVDFMSIEGTTDVMAFDGDPEDETLGDVAVNAMEAQRSAKRRKLPFMRELCLYAIHGSLHLCGYEDKTEEGKKIMRKLERKYLKIIGY